MDDDDGDDDDSRANSGSEKGQIGIKSVGRVVSGWSW